jgi:hypothetical protein
MRWRTKWTAMPMGLSIGIEGFSLIAETQFTVEDFRKRIQAMSDSQLLWHGNAARFAGCIGVTGIGRTPIAEENHLPED